jgi:hypothetical protein
MSPKVFDSLSDKAKTKYADTLIAPGNVFYLRIDDKQKYVVLIGKARDTQAVGIIFINTESYISGNEVVLSVEKNRYLKYQSYLDCSEVKPVELKYLIAEIKRNASCCVGKLSDEDWARAHHLLSKSPVMSRKLKKRYGLSN